MGFSAWNIKSLESWLFTVVTWTTSLQIFEYGDNNSTLEGDDILIYKITSKGFVNVNICKLFQPSVFSPSSNNWFADFKLTAIVPGFAAGFLACP